MDEDEAPARKRPALERDLSIIVPVRSSPAKPPSFNNSPSKHRLDGGDRYIPLRQPAEEWSTRYASISSPFKTPSSPQTDDAEAEGSDERRRATVARRALLRNELLGDNIRDIQKGEDSFDYDRLDITPGNGLFKYGSPQKLGSASTSLINYKNCPLSEDSRNLLTSPRKILRKISKTPYRVLDAPELQSDFYLNLLDWSAENILAVGLSSAVYLWNASSSEVTKLCDLTGNGNDNVTSVQWSDKGDLLAVGTNLGHVQLWDVESKSRVVEMRGHGNRVACIAWGDQTLCSGSRDRKIFERDLRAPYPIVRSLEAHKAEVCGLKWSSDKAYLASGGNDNRLYIWDTRLNQPIQRNDDHTAAIKALAWSPHNRGLLISGGGTQDRSLRFWNVLTGQQINSIDTGSQVCNVAWSKLSNEFVTTHGYSSNQVVVWKYPSLEPIAKLSSDTHRVLYMAMSPDGESIVTGTGGESGTLRFWRLFWKSPEQRTTNSKLNLFNKLR